MLKYLAKISMDILPSVLATIIGAYIVNHYINARPPADTPVAAVAPADAKKARPAEGMAGAANLPAHGIKARGISEKAVLDRPLAEKPAEKHVEQSAEAAVAPAAPRNHQSSPRERMVAKAAPTEGIAAPDANDLARAAIERLRRTSEAAPRHEAARVPEAPRVQEAPRMVTAAPAPQSLPPPITESAPDAGTYGSPAASRPENPPYTASVGTDDPNRPTPPADIPLPVVSPPLDLRADASASMPRAKTNVAAEMLSGVKSMFHAVLPKAVIPE